MVDRSRLAGHGNGVECCQSPVGGGDVSVVYRLVALVVLAAAGGVTVPLGLLGLLDPAGLEVQVCADVSWARLQRQRLSCQSRDHMSPAS
jgi:hypothetical protein